jgi:hypothetical protein
MPTHTTPFANHPRTTTWHQERNRPMPPGELLSSAHTEALVLPPCRHRAGRQPGLPKVNLGDHTRVQPQGPKATSASRKQILNRHCARPYQSVATHIYEIRFSRRTSTTRQPTGQAPVLVVEGKTVKIVNGTCHASRTPPSLPKLETCPTGFTTSVTQTLDHVQVPPSPVS